MWLWLFIMSCLLPGVLPATGLHQRFLDNNKKSSRSKLVRNFLTEVAKPWSHGIVVQGQELASGTNLPFQSRMDKDGRSKFMTAINHGCPLGAKSTAMFNINSTRYFQTDPPKTSVMTLTARCACYGKHATNSTTGSAAKKAKLKRSPGSKKCACPAQIVFHWEDADALRCEVQSMNVEHVGHPNPALIAPNISQDNNQKITPEERKSLVARFSEMVFVDRKSATEYACDVLGRRILARNIDSILCDARTKRMEILEIHTQDLLDLDDNLSYTQEELKIKKDDTGCQKLLATLKCKTVLLPGFKWIVELGGVSMKALLGSLSPSLCFSLSLSLSLFVSLSLYLSLSLSLHCHCLPQ